MADELDLSIIVVSYNVRHELERSLAAAHADSADLEAEIIVVDNASVDGSTAAVRAAFPAVTVIENPDNRFYSAANNQGFGRARGRFVLVLNPDAEIQPGTLPAVVEALAARPEVGLASCRMRWPDGQTQHNCCAPRSYLSLLLDNTALGMLLSPLRARIRRREWYADWDRESEREVGVLPGSFLIVRRDVLDAVGGFDERLRLYFAEDDWCARIRRHGHGVWYLSVGGVIHPEGASVRQTPRRARRIYFEDLDHFVATHFGRGRAGLLRTLARPYRLGLDVAGRRRGELG
jgi:hypothetical protein